MIPFFSVIIPLYNKEKYIQKTILSVLHQSISDFEIIIINDASTDNSLENAKKIIDNRLTYIENKENKGLSETRNIGIKHATGTVIAFLDADDIWLPNFLENIKNLYYTFPEATIYGTDYQEIYSKKNILEPKKNISNTLKNNSFLLKDFFTSSLFQPIFCPSSMAIKNGVFKDYEVFDSTITYAEDIDFYIKYCSRYKTAYCYIPLIKKDFNVPNQITKNKISDKKIPDLDAYGDLTDNNRSLKKYLDFHRYIFANQFTLEKDYKSKRHLLKNLNYRNLTFKQRLLLRSPRIVLYTLNKIKLFFLKYNFRATSF